MPGGIDYELRTRLHPEPPSEEELKYMKDIDPTAAGIFLHKLHTIAVEGNETLVKLGGSTGCRVAASSTGARSSGPCSSPGTTTCCAWRTRKPSARSSEG